MAFTSCFCFWSLFLLIATGFEGCNAATKDVQHGEGSCTTPYKPIGPDNYCLFIDNRIEGTWDEMRSLCKQLDGDLAFFDDANLLYEVAHYINNHSLNDASFWIGSQDLLKEGDWVWSWNNNDVRMNTPLWAPTRYSQEPSGGSYDNCGLLSKEDYYFMDDDRCDTLAGVICDPLNNIISRREKKLNKGSDSSQLADCPVPFQSMGESCLLIDSISLNTWEDSSSLCEGLGGQMAKIDDANVLGYLYDIFTNKSISVNLWLGGSDHYEEGVWLWEDGSKIKMDTPFWGIAYNGDHEPSGDIQENCLALAHSNYFYFNDVSCDDRAGVICQYDM